MPEYLRSTLVTAPRRRWRERNLRTAVMKMTAAFLLVVFVTVSLHGNWRLTLLLLCGGAGLWWFNGVRRRYYERAEILAEVDAMSADEFLSYIVEVLRAQGYNVRKRGRTNGPPANLLLSRGREEFACWLQHGDGPLRVETVARAAAVHSHTGWRAIVLSSQRLTLSAWYRARREGCVLINRAGLAHMVTQYRRGHRVLAFPREEAVDLRGRK